MSDKLDTPAPPASDLADEIERLLTARQTANGAIEYSRANAAIAAWLGEHWPRILTALRSDRAAVVDAEQVIAHLEKTDATK